MGSQPDQLRPENLPLRFSEDQQSIVGGQSTHDYPSVDGNVREMTQPFSTVCGGTYAVCICKILQTVIVHVCPCRCMRVYVPVVCSL